MNIVELLLKALEENDWEFVSEAYFLLSGTRKDPPDGGHDDISKTLSRLLAKQDFIANTVEKLQELIDGNTKTKEKKTNTKKETSDIDKDFSVRSNKPSRKVTDRTIENKFDDMADVIAEAGKENGYEKINDNIKRSNRSRKSYSPKTVTCTDCNSKSEVNPLFARDSYVCDKCLQKRGR